MQLDALSSSCAHDSHAPQNRALGSHLSQLNFCDPARLAEESKPSLSQKVKKEAPEDLSDPPKRVKNESPEFFKKYVSFDSQSLHETRF